MDKILITAFKSEVAAAILNSQKTDNNLNPKADAYIDADELPAVLEFFGETDVNKLLKTPSDTSAESVFTANDSSQPTGADATKKSKQDTDFNKDEFSQLMNPNNAIIRNDGSAAYELQQKVAGDLTMSTAAGTPFAAQMT